ncbi:MAG: hypothetical protein DCC67_09005 [Planctomycetota bacterium]|nr:MAG: hypothetical protein DCC67_09005 [Planctomycetota bacterium]
MKITNWRKKLAATLAAGGLLSPAAARAANLDENLVVNGTFESVNTAITGDYGAPAINNWLGGPGFAYSHQPNTTGIPDYADGDDPPGAGNWYFTPNNNPGSDTGDWREPNGVYQDVTLNAGATGSQIASGEAAVRLSAYMSSYLNDGDYGIVQVDFKNAGGTVIGSALIQDSDPGPNNVWNLNSGASIIPAATTSIRVSLYGGVVNGGTDGYMDNVDVQVTNAANEFLFAEVQANGQVAIRNLTGEAVQIDYYEITSASGALNATAWNSLQEQNLAGFPAGNGTGNGWEQAGGSGAGVISEGYLTGSSGVAHGANIGIGAAFNPGGAHDLVFKYAVVPPTTLTADFDGDGDADGADFLTWQRGFGISTGASKAQGDANGDGAVNAADLAAWKGEAGGGAFAGPGVLVQGFVRYVASAVAVPEASTMTLAGLGLAGAGLRGLGRRKAK